VYGLRVVGWYHSHPTFQPQPSVIDINNQFMSQCNARDAAGAHGCCPPWPVTQAFGAHWGLKWCNTAGREHTGRWSTSCALAAAAADGPTCPPPPLAGDEPYVAAIVSPYDRRLPGTQSALTWFVVDSGAGSRRAPTMDRDPLEQVPGSCCPPVQPGQQSRAVLLRPALLSRASPALRRPPSIPFLTSYQGAPARVPQPVTVRRACLPAGLPAVRAVGGAAAAPRHARGGGGAAEAVSGPGAPLQPQAQRCQHGGGLAGHAPHRQAAGQPGGGRPARVGGASRHLWCEGGVYVCPQVCVCVCGGGGGTSCASRHWVSPAAARLTRGPCCLLFGCRPGCHSAASLLSSGTASASKPGQQSMLPGQAQGSCP